MYPICLYLIYINQYNVFKKFKGIFPTVNQLHLFPSGLKFNHIFDNPDEMSELLQTWNLEQNLISNGVFKGIIKGLHTPFIQLLLAERLGAMLIQGDNPKDTISFNLFYKSNQDVLNGISISSIDEIYALENKDGIDYFTPEDNHIIVLTINKEFFLYSFNEYFDREYTPDKDGMSVFKVKNKKQLESELIELLKYFNSHQDILKNEKYVGLIEDHILVTLFKHVLFFDENKIITHVDEISNKLYSSLCQSVQHDINISQICYKLKISERTAYSIFKKNYGITPNKFIFNLRLSKVDRIFRESDASKIKIANIAKEYGFNHMGNFGQRYKERFGLTPSEVLKNI